MQIVLINELHSALRETMDPERAVHEKAYLKSDDPFLGVTVPAGQKVAKAFRLAHPALPSDVLRAVVMALWDGPFHEEKRLAVQLLDEYRTELVAEDWPMLEQWVRTGGSWDLIDETAAHLLGSMSERWAYLDAHYDAWVADANLWVRRAALVSHVLRLRHGTVSPVRVRQLCGSLMTDREYFVQKAVGWLLRECAVRDPEGTVAFLEDWTDITPRMVLREAVRKLDAALRQRVLG